MTNLKININIGHKSFADDFYGELRYILKTIPTKVLCQIDRLGGCGDSVLDDHILINSNGIVVGTMEIENLFGEQKKNV